jgi:hypothetical protein
MHINYAPIHRACQLPWLFGIMIPNRQREVPVSEDKAQNEHEHPQKHHEFHIQIDRVHYTVTERLMTGEKLRHVPPTPIGPDRDLFEVIPGGTDRKILDNEEVEIRDGKRFFTAPAQINPGKIR